jgi:hypothetical protein
MNCRPSGSLLLSKAIGGFIQYKAAEGLSPTTLRSYEDHLKLWVEHLGGKPVNWIKTTDVQELRRFGGEDDPQKITPRRRCRASAPRCFVGRRSGGAA